MDARRESGYAFRIVPFCAVACVLLGSCFLGLGGLRLYSLSLENRLNELSQRIEAALEQKAQFEVRVAELAAPSKVHMTARTTLGMCSPLQMAVVALPRPEHSERTSESDLRALMPPASSFAGFFSAPANAHD